MELTKKRNWEFEKLNTRSFPTYEKNPFMADLKLSIRPKRLTVARGSSLIDSSTGEIQGTTEVQQVVPVDETQFIKLYTANIGVFFDLSKSGLKVFCALMLAVQKKAGSDLVYLDLASLPEEVAISKQTFYRGLTELIENKFVAKHPSPNWFFVNPNLFFNGDRVRFVREYRKVNKDEYTIDMFDDAPQLEEQK